MLLVEKFFCIAYVLRLDEASFMYLYLLRGV